MFSLDPRTVIFVNFIYSIGVTIFMVVATLLKKYRFMGLANWIVAFFLLSLNFLILSLRSIIPVSIIFVLPHFLAVWAYIEVKRGLTRFYGMRNRVFTDFSIAGIFLMTLLLNNTNAKLRIVTLCVFSILVYLDIILLFTSKEGMKKTKSRVIPLLFSIATLVMIVRILLGLSWDPKGNPMESGNSLSIISILFFISNMVIFFSLLFIVINKTLDERDILIDRIRSLSLTDELTGLLNRRGFKDVTKHEINRFERTKSGFVFAICDIDFFKSVNDVYGHDCGDYVIKAMGNILSNMMREMDSTARWGGEEFVLLFPETSIEEANIALERIRKKIEETPFEYGEFSFGKTMSFGACYADIPPLDMDAVILKGR